MSLVSSKSALPSFLAGSQSWKPIFPEMEADQAAKLIELLQGPEAASFLSAIDQAVSARFARYQEGLKRYQEHPYRRNLETPPAIWQQGSARLLDYGPAKAGKRGKKQKEGGWPLLVIPSLVNRYYVLDLMEDRSFLRWLADQGWHPYVVDWGAPGEAERGFTLTDYIHGYLDAALSRIVEQQGRPPITIGYCMGGTLAAALAQHRQDDLAAAVFLATPWDFHDRQSGKEGQLRGALLAGMAPMVGALREMPVELLQSLFASLDYTLSLRKFSAFARLKQGSPLAESFVALEDWLNDGVPLVQGVAEECLQGWYGGNSPYLGQWRVGDTCVDPKVLTLPALSVIPEKDRIVPPGSAWGLARQLPQGELMEPDQGHIGMMVGRSAAQKVWKPLAAWMEKQVGGL